MKKLLAAVLALVPAAAVAQEFQLYQGSEGSLAYRQVRDYLGENETVDTLVLDTRHTVWMAPFLGAQIDLGGARVDWEETLLSAGVHLHVLPADGAGNRFGLFYVPTWDSDFDERLDNYGVEGIFQALPALTVEARVGRFDGADVEGPYVGLAGFYALDPQLALVGFLEHSRLEVEGSDLDTTDFLFGAQYFLPGNNLRITGGVGGLRYSGTTSGTDLRVEFKATLFAFGQPATTARPRTFGRQTFLGLF